MLSADFILFSQIIIPSISIHVKLCARVQEWEKMYFWVASTDATHIFVWIWGSNMAAFPVMVPDFFIL